jgi:hypothetical protein
MMFRMCSLGRLFVVSALVAATTSCGDVIRQGRSPVYLVMDSLQGLAGGSTGTASGTLNSDVIVKVTTPDPCTVTSPCFSIFDDFGQAVLRIASKDQSLVPTANNQVTITRYHVAYRRTDGRNKAGVDVPYDFDGAVTVTVPQTTSATVAFEIVRHSAKEEAPLVQLPVSGDIISTIAEVTLYGRDQVGNDISVTGSLSINFGNFADK